MNNTVEEMSLLDEAYDLIQELRVYAETFSGASLRVEEWVDAYKRYQKSLTDGSQKEVEFQFAWLDWSYLVLIGLQKRSKHMKMRRLIAGRGCIAASPYSKCRAVLKGKKK